MIFADTDSEDHAELRPSVRERFLKFCQKLAPIEIQVERTSVSRFTLHMSAARQRKELQVQAEKISRNSLRPSFRERAPQIVSHRSNSNI